MDEFVHLQSNDSCNKSYFCHFGSGKFHSYWSILNYWCKRKKVFYHAKVTIIYKTQKILQLKDIYNLEVEKIVYKYTSS